MDAYTTGCSGRRYRAAAESERQLLHDIAMELPLTLAFYYR